MPYTIGTLIFGISIHEELEDAKRYADEELNITDEQWDDFCYDHDLIVGEYYSWFGIELWEFNETNIVRFSSLEEGVLSVPQEELVSMYQEKLKKLPDWLQEMFYELPDFLIMWSHS